MTADPGRTPADPGRSLADLSLGTKLSAVVCACVAAMLVLAALLLLHRFQADTDAKARNLAGRAAIDLETRVDGEFRKAFEIVTTTADAIAAMWDEDIRDRRTVDVLLKRMLLANPDRFGAWTGWQPDAFDGRDREFANKEGSDSTGRYLTYWHQNGIEVTHDAFRNYRGEDAALFTTALGDGVAAISEPYSVDADSRSIPLVSFSAPVPGDGKAVGAVGLDVALAPLREGMAEIARPEGSVLVVVSNKGLIVVAPRAEDLGRPIAALDREAAAEFDRVRGRAGSARLVETPAGPAVRHWQAIGFGMVKSPWYVMAEVPLRAFAIDATRGATPTLLALSGMLLALLAAMLVAVRRLVSRPLATIARFITRFGGGERDLRVPETLRRDEIGSIARTLAKFQENEAEVARLRQADLEKERTFAASRRDELHALANTLAGSVQSLADVVGLTSREIVRRAETMAGAAAGSVNKTRGIADASVSAQSSVGAVDEAMAELRRSIESIAAETTIAQRVAATASQQTTSSTLVTAELSSRASRIGEIVDLIAAIASRTNMLALNATIEAARAGEAGRGFAVVAQEVKSLAAQTAAATREIGQQVTAMRATASGAARMLDAIGGTIAEISGMSVSITEAVRVQNVATDRIGASVGSAVAFSRQVNAAIDDVSRTASETGRAARDMLAESAKLTQESTRLDGEVLGLIARIRAS